MDDMEDITRLADQAQRLSEVTVDRYNQSEELSAIEVYFTDAMHFPFAATWRDPDEADHAEPVTVLGVVWHILARGCPDRFADPERVARQLLEHAKDLGRDRRPEGQTAVQYVRHHLDRLGLGAELASIPLGKTRRIALPSSLLATEANRMPGRLPLAASG